MKTYIKFWIKKALTAVTFGFLWTNTYADPFRMEIADDWSKQTDGQKRATLHDAAVKMQEQGSLRREKLRLVISDDRVYISDQSGEGWLSWGASFFVSESAAGHNIETNEALLDMVLGSDHNEVLKAMYQAESYSDKLKEKDVTLEVLGRFLEEFFKIKTPCIADGWSKQTFMGKRITLTKVIRTMVENGAPMKKLRLVISDDRVYISDQSGEGRFAWAASFFVSKSAARHNIETNEALLDMVSENDPREENKRCWLLRQMYHDEISSGDSLKLKDVTYEALMEFYKNSSLTKDPKTLKRNAHE